MTITKEIIDFVENFDKIKEMFKRLLFRLKYYLFWSKEDKKKSEELIKKYQIPKGVIGVKEVIISKEIIRKTR